VDYIAQSMTFTSGASASVTDPTTRPYIWADTRLHIPSGTVYEELKEFSFTVNNNLEAPHYLNGSRQISTPIPLNRDYELTATLDASSERGKTLYDQYFQGGSTFNAILSVSASAGSREVIMTLSGCKMTDMEAPSPNEGVNEFNLTIMPQTVSVLVNDDIELYAAW